ncbi:hypothetical protein [Olleya sp. YS]|uniref:hypothetical protein n=1 Tax=Olleya sp. YS TaxID=3028318 RepID=UPI00243464EE|nr:hypothetical protein [Olleya sp. YS]WGD34135.1 hypothetical protein Ollyesu_10145 [Olleya sp. YS]
MKTLRYFFLFTVLAVFTNCADDDTPEVVTQIDSRLFDIASFNNSGIFGSANFIKNSNNTVTIQVNLVGTTDGELYPAHIHFNTAAESGAIAVSLESVDGTTGQSETTFNTLDDGTPISYEALLDYDGHFVVHQSETNNAIVAQSDIGQNELTTNSMTYPLNEVDLTDVSGSITFTERINGEALAVISLSGSPAGGVHPAHIHVGSVATAPGAILFTFASVNGTTGISRTNVDALDDGTPFGYSDILSVDGYVNVHLSATNLGFLIAQGNVGVN